MKTSTKIIIAVVIVILLAAAGYYFYNKKKTATKTPVVPAINKEAVNTTLAENVIPSFAKDTLTVLARN